MKLITIIWQMLLTIGRVAPLVALFIKHRLEKRKDDKAADTVERVRDNVRHLSDADRDKLRQNRDI
jgi:hypothetical protein